MSVNYFNMLAARTLGTAERLGPIIPARFEPVQDWTSLGGEDGERLVFAEPSRRSEMAQAEGSTALEETDVRTRAERPARNLPDDGPPPPSGEPQKIRAARPPIVPLLSAMSGPARETRAGLAAPGPPPSITRIVNDDLGADGRAYDQHVHELSDDSRPLVPRSTPPMPAQGRQVEPAERGRDATVSPQTVIVRIGRVDVRAVTTPPPPPAVSPARSNSRPSLADHLRARNEGRR